jgi:hypothetical protein
VRVANLTDPTIDSGLGVLRRDGTIVLPGTSVQRASGEPELPGPGWYRFFWLRDRSSAESPAHRLLSARPVAVSELAPWRPEELAAARERLAAVLDAGPAEVSVDRPAPGQLTQDQRRAVRRWLRRRETRAAVAVALSLGLLAVLAAIGYGVAVAHLDGLIELGLLPLLALPLPLAIGDVWSKARDAQGLRAALDGRQPALCLDTAVLVIGDEENRRVLGDLDFQVNAEVADAFESGRYYTLYYLPRPRQVLCAEPVARDEPVDT